MPKNSDPKSPVKHNVIDGVETYEAKIEGETIIWDRELTYGRHLQTDQLLSSQAPLSGQPDEMVFIIMHQTMELWIKLLIHETRVAITDLREDRFGKVSKRLERCSAIMRHMIQSWEVLATLSPPEFLTFRGYLGRASGFQSQQYRELEFLLGLKRADLILLHEGNDGAKAQLTATLNEPSLYDEVLRALARAGVAIPAEKQERDWTKPYQPCEQVEDAWYSIYANPDAHWDLYTLGEKVTALEYYFQEWRFKHMKTVSRVIGNKKGTGGSAGVAYLVKALETNFFPELWTMRTKMTVPMVERGDSPE